MGSGSPHWSRTSAPSPSAPSVLFIDPQPAYLEPIVRAFRQRYVVGLAQTAQGAFALLHERVPSLIVLDLDLPDADGSGVVRAFRRAPATQQVPIIVLTARASPMDKIAAMQAGADHYLVKPISLDEFLGQLRLLDQFNRALWEWPPGDGR